MFILLQDLYFNLPKYSISTYTRPKELFNDLTYIVEILAFVTKSIIFRHIFIIMGTDLVSISGKFTNQRIKSKPFNMKFVLGASSEMISIFSGKMGKIVDTFDSNDECSICLNGMKRCIVSHLPCGHNFHKYCIFRWMDRSKSCPICRGNTCCARIS